MEEIKESKIKDRQKMESIEEESLEVDAYSR